MKINTLRHKIFFGYGLILLLLILIILGNYQQLNDLKEMMAQIKDLRLPSTQADQRIISGLRQSISSLRGLIILGDDKFKQQRLEAWKAEIKPSFQLLERLFFNWKNLSQINGLRSLEVKLDQLEKFQEEIESIANTPENTPARKILFLEAAPQAKIVTDSITYMIELEKKQEATKERKQLLAMMADFRGSIGLGLASIRAFLLSGDEKFWSEFETFWGMNQKAFIDLNTNLQLLTSVQKERFKRLVQAREIFATFPPKMFKIRSSYNWNISNYNLKTKVLPLVIEIEDTLQDIAYTQEELMNKDFESCSQQINDLVFMKKSLLGVSIICCVFIAFVTTHSIYSPIRDTIKVANSLAKGDFETEINLSGSQEVEELSVSLRRMMDILKENQERMEAIVDTAADGILTIDEKGIVETMNEASIRLFGYKREEVVGKNISILMPEPDRSNHNGYLENYLNSNVPKIIGIGREVVGKRKDGTTFPLYLSVGEAKLQEKQFFTGILRDMTKEKKASEELQEKTEEMEKQDWIKTNVTNILKMAQGIRDQQQLAQKIISKLSSLVEAGHGVFYLNQQKEMDSEEVALVLLGTYAYTERKNISNQIKLGEGLIGQSALEKKTILLTNVPSNYVQIKSGLGEEAPLNIFVLPILFENHILGVIEFASFKRFTPIQEEMLNQVVVNLGVFINNLKNQERTKKLLYQSQKLTEETRVQAEELQQQSEELRASNEELEEKSKEIEKQSEMLQATNEELEEKTEELYQQKAEIEQKNIFLEKTKKEIEKKKDELELTSKYKSEFLANMSHELRTPLNSILLLSKSLSKNDNNNLDEDQIESLKVVYGSGEDLLHLINDILDLSKVEAGKMEIFQEELFIEVILASLQAMFEPLIKEKGLEFKIEKIKDLPASFYSDEQRVKQILKNLLSNATKFTKKGTISLKVHRPDLDTKFYSKKLSVNSAIAFSVSDTGIGVSQEKQKAIFEAFQQADGSIDRHYGGTGLGLTISRELARLLGGEIQIQSQEGLGSTFTLYLPLEFTSSHSDEKESQKASAKNQFIKVLPTLPLLELDLEEKELVEFIPDDRHLIKKGDKILLVIEDDANFAKILLGLGQKRDYKCLVAGDGKNGLKMALKFLPTAILLDIGLPDIDGIQILEYLKDNLNTRHIPIHIISGKNKSSDSLQKGAIGFLTKPTTEDSLREVFSKFDNIVATDIRQLLIVEDNLATYKAIVEILKNEKIVISHAKSGKEAYQLLQSKDYDSIILDLQLGDITGFELLQKLKRETSVLLPPIIIYTARELTREEHQELSKYAETIVIKGVNSPERLLDEVSLFLHSIESTLPEGQRKVIQMLHKEEDVFSGKKILLVDDDLRNTFALSKILNEKGLEVLIADNGQLALEKLDSDPEIDLVLMDIMMPIMDGYQTIQKIRIQNCYEKLPIIALTAKAMLEERQQCLKAGANDYLSKPIDTDKLFSLLRVWLFNNQKNVN